MSVTKVRFPSKEDLRFPLREATFQDYGFLTTGPNNSHYQKIPFPTFWFFSLGWSLFQSAFHFFLVLTNSIEQLHNWKNYITRTFSAFGPVYSNINKGPRTTVDALNSFKQTMVSICH